jgi:type 1 glutamine amidotransferase
MGLSCRLLVAGPTPYDVKTEKMKVKNVSWPTDQQARLIEAAAPGKAPVKVVKPRKVLVWGHVWTHQPNPYAEKALEILARKSGAFEAVISDDPRLLLTDKLSQFDAIVMNNIHEREPFLPDDFAKRNKEQKAAALEFDRTVKQSILDYVRSGKGLVGIHAATAAFQKWPEYGDMIGGYYGGHISQDVVIKPEDPDHPVNACFGRELFRIKDEIYIPREPYSRKNLRVIASLDLSKMEDPEKRPDKDYPISWVRSYGKGRIFYTTLGHAPATYWNPVFLRHLLAGIQFATGDLEGPTEPVGVR